MAGKLSSPELTFRADSYSMSAPHPLQQWHVKDPGHSVKSAGGRLHQDMHTPLTQQSWSGLTMLMSRHGEGTYQEMNELTCNSSRNTQSQSSKLAESLWTNPGVKSGISVHELIST